MIAFLAGGLPQDKAERVDGHVESCQSCRLLVAAVAKSSRDATPVAAATLAVGSNDATLAAVDELAMSPTLAGAATPAAGDGVKRGEQVGRYVIQGVLGKGGMGVVYAAFDPQLDRKVAVKLLRPELAAGGGEAAAARLLREGRAIAKLAHPNVVTVFDVGTHDGSVFVAMELVEGRSLDHWIAEKRRPWREVLGVFRQAGAGLIAAHDAGMIHRDFKPANVLMGKDGRARVTDFGLARFGGERTSKPRLAAGTEEVARLTRTGALLGTPAYMSPEQFEGGEVDAKSDQFSFAVALYEALYGSRPFAGLTVGELFANITEKNVRPAPEDSTVPAWLRETVLRGLEPAPANRYPTLASLLVALEHDPALKRRRVAFAAGGVSVLGLGVVATVLVLGRTAAPSCRVSPTALAGAWDAPRRADVERAFGASKAPYAKDQLAVVLKELDTYAADWTAMKKDACEAAQVRHEQTEQQQGLRTVCLEQRTIELRAITDLLAHADEDVIRNAHKAVAALTPLAGCADLRALSSRVPPPADTATRIRVDALRSRLAKARAIGTAGKYTEAQAAATQLAGEAAQLGYRPLHAEALLLAGALAERAGDAKTAEAQLTQAVQAAEAGRDDLAAAQAWVTLVRVRGISLGKADDALVAAGHASAMLERFGGDAEEQLKLDAYRGLVLSEQGKYAEATALAEKVLAARRREVPPAPLDLASALNDVGNRYEEMGKYAEAAKAQAEALALREKQLGPNHPEVAATLHNLGNTQFELGDLPAAEASFRRSLAIREKALGPTHPEVALVVSNLGVLMRTLGKYDEAIAFYQRALAIKIERLGPEHPSIATVMHNIGATYMTQKKFPEAIEFLDKGLALAIKVRGPEHSEVAAFYGTLSQCYRGQAKFDEAFAAARKALAINEKALGPEHPEVATDHSHIGELYLSQSKYVEALAAFQRALAIHEKTLGPDHPDLAIALSNIGNAQIALGKHADAAKTYERALALDEKGLGKDHPDLTYDITGLGDVYEKLGRHDDAVAILERGLTLRDGDRIAYQYALTKLYLGRALWNATKPDKARAKKLVAEAAELFAKGDYKIAIKWAKDWQSKHR
ncbi:MAG: serine/threonine protein kinase [Kofleriaceae bacterium]|nr:serine/threonine protein kinase [Kofleriaceae bacterium]